MTKIELINQYDSMIVEEFDLAFPGLRAGAPVGEGVGLSEFDLSNTYPLKKSIINFYDRH